MDTRSHHLHQRQATSTWWCSPLPCTGENRNGLSIPRGSHPRAILPWTTLLLIFHPCCPMRGHIWTAFLNPIDRPPISSTFFWIILLSPSFHPKPLHYLSHPPLILIFMLLLISGDIHPNPGSTDPCSVCSRRVTWGNRSIQFINCSLWVHLSCSGSGLGLGLVWVFLPLTFVKSPRNTLGLAQCAHPLLNPSPPSHTLILYLHPFLYLYPFLYLHPFTLQIPHPHSQTPTKPYLQKLTTPPKQPRITPPILLITLN